MILLTGGSGQLGRELRKLDEYLAPTRDDLDITNEASVANYLSIAEPERIVHAAAFTGTLLADQSPELAQLCYQTNVLGTRYLVKHARCPIVFISTEACVHPYSFYVLTKLQAEFEVSQHKYGYTILRTSFRRDPFEYDFAFSDMWTIGDSDHVIAKLIREEVQKPIWNQIVYVGTGAKTVFQLARRTRADVKPCVRSDIAPYLPAMDELMEY